MGNATWDMITEGDAAGTLVRPLQYTATDDDATRVRVYQRLATPLGAWKLSPSFGLDYERMLAPDTSDAERAAYVRDLVLEDKGVDSIVGEPEITVEDNTLAVSVTFLTVNGAIISIGA